MSDEYLKCLSAFKNIEIAGIYSRTKKKSEILALKYKIPYIAKNIKELYNHTLSDGVITAVSVESLIKLYKEIFKFPWACLIEKPIGVNYKQNLQIIKKAKNLNKFNCYVALNRRYFGSTNKLKEIIAKDKSQRLIVVNDQQFTKKPSIIKKHPKIVLENMMYANSVHLLDYFKIFGRGKIIKLNKEILKINNKKIVTAKIFFNSGDIGIYFSAWEFNWPWSVCISNDKNIYELKPLEILNHKKIMTNKNVTYSNFKLDKLYKPGLYNQTKDFIHAINKGENLLTNIYENKELVKLIRNIYF